MKICICAIAKEENNYLREWVEYHKNIGVSKIFLYDNNDLDGEKFEDVINDYIESGFVQVISCLRGIGYSERQAFAYTDFYKSDESLEYDWIAYIDIDEYLNSNGNFIDILSDSKYDKFDCIRIFWRIFTDNGLVRVTDTYNLHDRFKEWYLDRNGKSLLRPGKNYDLITAHGAYQGFPACNENGCAIRTFEPGRIRYNPSAQKIWLDHFRFKTIEEFVLKAKKGDPCTLDRSITPSYLTLDYFFSRNELTQEKIDYLKSVGIDYKKKDEEE